MAHSRPRLPLPSGTQGLLQRAQEALGIPEGLLALVWYEDLLASPHGAHGSHLDNRETLQALLTH